LNYYGVWFRFMFKKYQTKFSYMRV
jgi:hypothetical protein